MSGSLNLDRTVSIASATRAVARKTGNDRIFWVTRGKVERRIVVKPAEDAAVTSSDIDVGFDFGRCHPYEPMQVHPRDLEMRAASVLFPLHCWMAWVAIRILYCRKRSSNEFGAGIQFYRTCQFLQRSGRSEGAMQSPSVRMTAP